jgi:hypothetical protein
MNVEGARPTAETIERSEIHPVGAPSLPTFGDLPRPRLQAPMIEDPSEAPHHVVDLPPALNRCHHGLHLQAIRTERCPKGWCVHGYHGCLICGRVTLACVAKRPDEVLIVGRRIPVLLA